MTEYFTDQEAESIRDDLRVIVNDIRGSMLKAHQAEEAGDFTIARKESRAVAAALQILILAYDALDDRILKGYNREQFLETLRIWQAKAKEATNRLN